MYKLAKFRKQLKENVSEARYKRTQEAVNDFKSCFYARDYFHESGFINRSVRVRWDRYYALKIVIKNNKSPCFGWAHAKEGMKYGQ